MHATISILLAGIFFFLAALHLYWVAGGKWALDGVIPLQQDGNATFSPPPFLTVLVALGLGLMGLVELFAGAWLNWPFWGNFLKIGLWIIAGIFLIRAIGDFRYAGFFKRVKGTVFAQKDSQIYSPLCLLLSLGTLVLILF